MPLVVITEPSIEPVTVAELKVHCRIDADLGDEDSLLESIIKAARLHGENVTKRQFVECTRELIIDAFPASGIIELPRPPLQSVTSVKYLDSDGEEQTLSTDYYDVDTDSEPGRVLLAYGQDWPTTRDQLNAVTVRYVTGWPVTDDVATTPEAIKHWIKIRCNDLYANRESIVPGTIISSMPRHFADSLLDPYVIPSL
jgi:uncharacterized phiE125 gp8 family phage protein